MITLFQGPPFFGLPNMSPFCIKVETYLRMVELPFEVRTVDPRKAPKGKIPFIEDDGIVVPDSAFIIKHLKQRHGDPLDAHLSPNQRATAHAVRRMLEEGTYWAGVYSRWFELDNWPRMRQLLAQLMPPVVGRVVPPLIRRSVKSALFAQGTGRHSREEVYEIGKEDITALSVLLGDQPFIMGEQPSSVDATVYAFVASILVPPLASPLREHAQSLPNLEAYRARMEQRYFGAD
jgi:glutathione S-transferase